MILEFYIITLWRVEIGQTDKEFQADIKTITAGHILR